MGAFDLPLAQKVALFVALPVASILLYYLLKKSHDEDEEEAQPRIVTSRQTVIEVKVPRYMTGSIIGMRGARIKEVQDATGARIQFKDDTSPDTDRTCVIRGTVESAQRAELIVRRMIAEEPPIVEESISVPQRCIGRIIGRGGETIRQLCRLSKAKIQVPQEDKSTGGLRTIHLQGSPNAISTAKNLISEKVQEDEAFRARTAISASNRQERGPRRRPDGATESDHSKNGEPEKASEEERKEQKDQEASKPSAESEVETAVTPPAEWPSNRQDYLDVYVSAVENPGHFWVQVISSKSTRLDRLMEDMTRYYTSLDGAKMTVTDPQVGDLLAAPFEFDQNWYRVRVAEVKEDELDLYYVDFGDSCYLKKSEVRNLRGDFLSLPFQAIEACLANVKPKGGEWSEEAIVLFEDMTYTAKWKVIQASTFNYIQVEDVSMPCLDLVDTQGSEDINIAKVLIKKGFAEFAQEKASDDTSSLNKSSLPQMIDSTGSLGNKTRCVLDVNTCASGSEFDKSLLNLEELPQPTSAIKRIKEPEKSKNDFAEGSERDLKSGGHIHFSLANTDQPDFSSSPLSALTENVASSISEHLDDFPMEKADESPCGLNLIHPSFCDINTVSAFGAKNVLFSSDCDFDDVASKPTINVNAASSNLSSKEGVEPKGPIKLSQNKDHHSRDISLFTGAMAARPNTLQLVPGSGEGILPRVLNTDVQQHGEQTLDSANKSSLVSAPRGTPPECTDDIKKSEISQDENDGIGKDVFHKNNSHDDLHSENIFRAGSDVPGGNCLPAMCTRSTIVGPIERPTGRAGMEHEHEEMGCYCVNVPKRSKLELSDPGNIHQEKEASCHGAGLSQKAEETSGLLSYQDWCEEVEKEAGNIVNQLKAQSEIEAEVDEPCSPLTERKAESIRKVDQSELEGAASSVNENEKELKKQDEKQAEVTVEPQACQTAQVKSDAVTGKKVESIRKDDQSELEGAASSVNENEKQVKKQDEKQAEVTVEPQACQTAQVKSEAVKGYRLKKKPDIIENIDIDKGDALYDGPQTNGPISEQVEGTDDIPFIDSNPDEISMEPEGVEIETNTKEMGHCYPALLSDHKSQTAAEKVMATLEIKDQVLPDGVGEEMKSSVHEDEKEDEMVTRDALDFSSDEQDLFTSGVESDVSSYYSDAVEEYMEIPLADIDTELMVETNSINIKAPRKQSMHALPEEIILDLSYSSDEKDCSVLQCDLLLKNIVQDKCTNEVDLETINCHMEDEDLKGQIIQSELGAGSEFCQQSVVIGASEKPVLESITSPSGSNKSDIDRYFEDDYADVTCGPGMSSEGKNASLLKPDSMDTSPRDITRLHTEEPSENTTNLETVTGKPDVEECCIHFSAHGSPQASAPCTDKAEGNVYHDNSVVSSSNITNDQLTKGLLINNKTEDLESCTGQHHEDDGCSSCEICGSLVDPEENYLDESKIELMKNFPFASSENVEELSIYEEIARVSKPDSPSSRHSQPGPVDKDCSTEPINESSQNTNHLTPEGHTLSNDSHSLPNTDGKNLDRNLMDDTLSPLQLDDVIDGKDDKTLLISSVLGNETVTLESSSTIFPIGRVSQEYVAQCLSESEYTSEDSVSEKTVMSLSFSSDVTSQSYNDDGMSPVATNQLDIHLVESQSEKDLDSCSDVESNPQKTDTLHEPTSGSYLEQSTTKEQKETDENFNNDVPEINVCSESEMASLDEEINIGRLSESVSSASDKFSWIGNENCLDENETILLPDSLHPCTETASTVETVIDSDDCPPGNFPKTTQIGSLEEISAEASLENITNQCDGNEPSFNMQTDSPAIDLLTEASLQTLDNDFHVSDQTISESDSADVGQDLTHNGRSIPRNSEESQSNLHIDKPVILLTQGEAEATISVNDMTASLNQTEDDFSSELCVISSYPENSRAQTIYSSVVDAPNQDSNMQMELLAGICSDAADLEMNCLESKGAIDDVPESDVQLHNTVIKELPNELLLPQKECNDPDHVQSSIGSETSSGECRELLAACQGEESLEIMFPCLETSTEESFDDPDDQESMEFYESDLSATGTEGFDTCSSNSQSTLSQLIAFSPVHSQLLENHQRFFIEDNQNAELVSSRLNKDDYINALKYSDDSLSAAYLSKSPSYADPYMQAEASFRLVGHLAPEYSTSYKRNRTQSMSDLPDVKNDDDAVVPERLAWSDGEYPDLEPYEGRYIDVDVEDDSWDDEMLDESQPLPQYNFRHRSVSATGSPSTSTLGFNQPTTGQTRRCSLYDEYQDMLEEAYANASMFSLATTTTTDYTSALEELEDQDLSDSLESLTAGGRTQGQNFSLMQSQGSSISLDSLNDQQDVCSHLAGDICEICDSNSDNSIEGRDSDRPRVIYGYQLEERLCKENLIPTRDTSNQNCSVSEGAGALGQQLESSLWPAACAYPALPQHPTVDESFQQSLPSESVDDESNYNSKEMYEIDNISRPESSPTQS